MPKEYIEREAAIKDVQSIPISNDFAGLLIELGVEKAVDALNKVPAADVVEVVRARWILNRDGSGTCSNCHRTQGEVWDMDTWQNFCGHCGADMREVEYETD